MLEVDSKEVIELLALISLNSSNIKLYSLLAGVLNRAKSIIYPLNCLLILLVGLLNIRGVKYQFRRMLVANSLVFLVDFK